MLLGLFLNLGVLFYFKYHDFFFENLNGAFGLHLTLNHLALPLGISFFTFQQLSYVIDSYKRTVPRYNILDYSLFVTFFPQLIAGPIVLHSEIVPQFADVKNRHFNFDHFAPGLYAFARGLVKKVVIADTFAVAVEAGFADALTLNTAEAWFVAIGYTLQLYFDFSGYCDMATGVGLMFNIKIPINFNSPYKSLNIREFWQRWHVTLSRFLTTYVYFPLGGSRKGLARTCVNLMIVFLLSGLWHGAAMNYVAWGAANGALQVAESFLPRRFNEPRGRLGRCAKALLTFIVIDATWLLFRAHALSTALHMAERMVRCATVAPMATGFTFPQALVLVVGLAALGALDALHERGHTLTAWLDRRPAALRMALMLLGVLLVVIFGVWGTNYDAQAFIYFQF